MRIFGEQLDDQDKPFLWLAEVVRTSDVVELRREAAANLMCLPNAPDRVVTIRSLLADEQDKEVIRHLKAALNPPQSNK